MDMVRCSAVGCKNRSGRTVKRVSYHKFPKDPVRRRTWADIVRGPLWIPSERALLCSKHFEEKCFDRTGQTVRLREGAIPTLMGVSQEINAKSIFINNEIGNYTVDSAAGKTNTMGMNSGENIEHETGPENNVFTGKMAKAKGGSEQVRKLCRLCGKLKDDVTSIFSAKGATLHLREKLEHLLRITVAENDKLPKHVCSKCVLQLNMCDSMMEFFKQTQNSLQKELELDSTHDEASIPSVKEDIIPNDVEQQTSTNPSELQFPVNATESEDNDISDIQGTNNTEFDPATLDEDVLFSMHGIKVKLPVPCDFCGEVFDNLETFDQHIASHKEQRVFSCQLCSNTYVSWSNLVAHRRACHGGNVLACDKCSSRTYHPGLVPVNYMVKDFPVGCEECEEGFQSMVELSRHYRVSISHHGNSTALQDQVMCSTNDNGTNEVGTNSEDGGTGSLHDEFPVNISAVNIDAHSTNSDDGLQPSAMCVDFVCSLCGGQFPTSEELDQHVAKLQDDSSGLLCRMCDMRFCDKNMFTAHQQLHSSNHNHISKDFEEIYAKENRAKCERCDDAADCKHIVDVNKKLVKEEYACFDCSISYSKLEQLEAHVNNMHLSCKAVTCNVCKKRFGAEMFICHYVQCVVSNNNDQDLLHLHSKMCTKCSNAQVQTAESKHLRESNSPKMLHTCEVCNKQMDRLDRIILHAKSHYGPDECDLPFKYVEMIRLLGSKKQQPQSPPSPPQSPSNQQEECRCEYCGKMCVNKLALVSHERLHSKADTHVCQLCSKAFVTEKHLMVHVLRHTNEQVHECERCYKVFPTAESLQVHKMTHKATHTCPHCNKTLSGRLNYLGHIRLHMGERPYRCSFCARAFTLKHRLNLHIKLKHGNASSDNEFVCDEMEESEET